MENMRSKCKKVRIILPLVLFFLTMSPVSSNTNDTQKIIHILSENISVPLNGCTPPWSVITGTQYNMIALGDVYQDTSIVNRTGFFLACFGPGGDSDCRSVVQVNSNGSYYMTIVGDTNGQDLTFKVWDCNNGQTFNVAESFKFQADDLKSGYDFHFNTDTPLSISTPNGGENAAVGDAFDITWTQTVAPVQGLSVYRDSAVTSVKLEYSTDNGSNWSDIIASTANDGSYSWTVPDAPSSQCLVRISDTVYPNNVDVSNATFTIFTPRDDLLGSWSGQGIYYKNSNSGVWVYLATPASMVTAGDLDGDGIDDLIGIWTGQGGVWAYYSNTSQWALISTTADWIAAGDMNGDGRPDLLGSWSGQGVYYKNTVSGAWVQLATPATQVVAGDLDGDGTDDLLGIWAGQGGVWVKYSFTGGWDLLSSSADFIGAGDMNGNGRDDLFGTWAGQGVYYRNSVSGAWVYMASPATQVVAGDLDGDGTDDLIGIWAGQGGVWVKKSSTGGWELLSGTADWIAAGRMRRGPTAPIPAAMQRFERSGQIRINAPGVEGEFIDLSDFGPGGRYFRPKISRHVVPGSKIDRKEESVIIK